MSPDVPKSPAALDSRARALLESTSFADVLSDANLGTAVIDSAHVLSGRNTNVAVHTDSGVGLFVKLVDPDPSNTGFDHTMKFENFARINRASMHSAGVPTLLASSHEHGILVYELVPDARTLAATFDERDMDATKFEVVGRQLAVFHSAAEGIDSIPVTPHRFPPLGSLRALPLRYWTQCSAGELEAWSLMQSDRPLLDALADLRAQEAAAPQRPIHGDMRLDQVLLDETSVYLTDFEDFRLGDPARDIGALLGDLTYRAVLSIIKDWSGDFALDADLTHETILDRGTDALDAQRPAFTEFWNGYRSVTEHLDSDLTTRATAWVGWHMFDRLLAAGKDRNRLLSVHRAAAGIGRAATMDPVRFSATFEAIPTGRPS
ncbi:class V lanthionine synthetase subunit LxmK [Rhodococcus sp. G-MC3]|uniref:class V lanthionine synthetase subunit LxmK n=1 Tax=Rhodococcus sp. G-MC3 TaxID=3046209 RepID=UPI0024B8EB66|nr:class V lanthionine synthetase subunit LxmK [Rhodococcus sp. G-MC3]MDJ0393819.1 class V lanthionine synthetase subunit LxmK [Rhodococcus sp. G-MC3]